MVGGLVESFLASLIVVPSLLQNNGQQRHHNERNSNQKKRMEPFLDTKTKFDYKNVYTTLIENDGSKNKKRKCIPPKECIVH